MCTGGDTCDYGDRHRSHVVPVATRSDGDVRPMESGNDICVALEPLGSVGMQQSNALGVSYTDTAFKKKIFVRRHVSWIVGRWAITRELEPYNFLYAIYKLLTTPYVFSNATRDTLMRHHQ